MFLGGVFFFVLGSFFGFGGFLEGCWFLGEGVLGLPLRGEVFLFCGWGFFGWFVLLCVFMAFLLVGVLGCFAELKKIMANMTLPLSCEAKVCLTVPFSLRGTPPMDKATFVKSHP